MKQTDLLAVGDMTIDSFIRLKDANVHCEVSRERCQLSMDFGAKIPFDFVEDVMAVGNASNAAVSAHRLGLSSALVSDIGKDENGKHCLETLEKEGVDTVFVSAHDGVPTNHHFVLWYEDERTILVKHNAYPYHFPEVPAPRWMYLTSIGPDSEIYHTQIAAYLAKHPEVKLAFQPGTFQINAGVEKMEPFYHRADVVAVNADEATKIIGGSLTIPDMLSELRRLGPKIALITDGQNGSYLDDSTSKWHLPIYPDEKPPYSRTGAGDATTSSLVSGIALGKEPLEALQWGHVNARSVVQQVGSQKGLMTRDTIEQTLKEAPEEFKAEKIS